LGSIRALPTTDNKKVMVVHGRDKARDPTKRSFSNWAAE
jgi:hypothetical protein